MSVYLCVYLPTHVDAIPARNATSITYKLSLHTRYYYTLYYLYHLSTHSITYKLSLYIRYYYTLSTYKLWLCTRTPDV